jgi:hypothetical protein
LEVGDADVDPQVVRVPVRVRREQRRLCLPAPEYWNQVRILLLVGANLHTSIKDMFAARVRNERILKAGNVRFLLASCWSDSAQAYFAAGEWALDKSIDWAVKFRQRELSRSDVKYAESMEKAEEVMSRREHCWSDCS